MLSGASSIRHVRLHVQLLQCLPMSGAKQLASLHLHTCITEARAVSDVVQAVLECRKLEDLSITCSGCDLDIPVLNLQHLLRLRKCSFSSLSAPGSLLLSQGAVELSASFDKLAAWSEMQHQVQDHVLCMSLYGFHGVLQAWPQGIQAFRNLQFLQVNCFAVWPSAADDILDLADFAYIPHVSLRTLRSLSVRVSSGSWKILDLQSSRMLRVAFDDVKAFVKSIGAFYFQFKTDQERPEGLISKLEEAGADTGTVLYEHLDKPGSPWVVLSNTRPLPGNAKPSSEAFLRAHSRYQLSK